MSEEELIVSKVILQCTSNSKIEARLFPCNVITEQDIIKTDELEQLYPTPEEPLGLDRQTLYLRGRKIIGSEINIENHKPYITVVDSLNNIHCETKIDKILNFEREGNENRRISEETKFKEYIDLMNIIME
ncbi:hypothetical protein QEN19_002875 [Hanseniaspora menglaensis]